MTPGKKWKFPIYGFSLFRDLNKENNELQLDKIVVHTYPRPPFQEVWSKLKELSICQNSVKIIEAVKLGYVFHVETSITDLIKANFKKIVKHKKPCLEIENLVESCKIFINIPEEEKIDIEKRTTKHQNIILNHPHATSKFKPQ